MSCCKNCGAPAEPGDMACAFCGVASNAKSVVSYEEFLADFGQRHLKLHKNLNRMFDPAGKRAAQEIAMIYIPDDIENLIKLGLFSKSNAERASKSLNFSNYQNQSGIAYAWISKVREIQGRIVILGKSSEKAQILNSQINSIIPILDDQLSKTRNTMIFFIAGAMLFLLIAALIKN